MATVTTPLGSRASANLRFFGTAEGGGGDGAAWFQPEKLSAPDFSVEAFVADLRQYAPLETLSGELEAYLTMLKSKARHSKASIRTTLELQSLMERDERIVRQDMCPPPPPGRGGGGGEKLSGKLEVCPVSLKSRGALRRCASDEICRGLQLHVYELWGLSFQ